MALGMFGLPEAMFIAALMLHDLRTTARLHQTTIWGSGMVLVGAVSGSWLSHTDLWLGFARAVQSTV